MVNETAILVTATQKGGTHYSHHTCIANSLAIFNRAYVYAKVVSFLNTYHR